MDRYIAGPRSASGEVAPARGHARLAIVCTRPAPRPHEATAAPRARSGFANGRAARTGRAPTFAGRCAEDGFSLIEALIATALVSSAIVGATVVFGTQAHIVSQTMASGALQDAVAAVDVDANALQAYDPAVRQTLLGAGQQLWTVSGAGGDPIVMQAQPSANGVSVIAKRDNQAASVVVPLPAPKPQPQ